jgi:hypothetical protein
MGTSYCALFFFMTQDIVSAGIKDTPMTPPCQLTPKTAGFDCKSCFSELFHIDMKHMHSCQFTSKHEPGAGNRQITGFRFVANPGAGALPLLK